MKARYMFLLVPYAISFVVLALAAAAASAGEQAIPEPSGQYALSIHGSLALCLNPAENFAPGVCGASGVTTFPLTDEEIGTVTYGSGIGCESYYQVLAALPPNTLPTIVTLNGHLVITITTYDRATGVGTISFIGYTGGSCNGASFDSSGATEASTGTIQFVVVNKKHIEILVTQLTSPTNSIASPQISGTDLKQTH